MLIVEAENSIWRNSGVSNVYMFLHADFGGVGFYATRRHVHLTREGLEEDLFVSDEEEKYE